MIFSEKFIRSIQSQNLSNTHPQNATNSPEHPSVDPMEPALQPSDGSNLVHTMPFPSRPSANSTQNSTLSIPPEQIQHISSGTSPTSNSSSSTTSIPSANISSVQPSADQQQQSASTQQPKFRFNSITYRSRAVTVRSLFSLLFTITFSYIITPIIQKLRNVFVNALPFVAQSIAYCNAAEYIPSSPFSSFKPVITTLSKPLVKLNVLTSNPAHFRSDPTTNTNCQLMYVYDNHNRAHLSDTGSQVTALPFRYVQKDFRPKPLPFDLLSVGDAVIKTYGYYKHTVSIGTQNFTYEFLVADVPVIVLGVDFFRAFGWVLDPRANTVTCNRIEIPCFPSDKPSLCLHTITTPNPLIEQLKTKFKPLFDINVQPLVKHHQIEHRINLKPNARPPEQARVYHYSPEVEEEIDRQFRELEEQGICRRSNSNWSSPIVVVIKKNGRIRCAVDFRYLNKFTLNDSYSLPNMNAFNNKVAGSTVFSVIDIDKAFQRVMMRTQDIPLTAVQTPNGLFEYIYMPYGLKTAPQTWQRLIDGALKRLREFCFAFVDDILVYSRSVEEHAIHLERVFQALLDHGLKINTEKCQLFKKEVVYLGYRVDQHGVHPTRDRINAIENWPVPQTYSKLKSFLCSVNFYMRFVRNYAETSSILASIPQPPKKNDPIHLTSIQLAAFYKLKSMLTNYTMLSHPRKNCTLILESDASDIAMGACLSQIVDQRPEPLFFFSRAFSDKQKHLDIYRKELIAMYCATKRLNKFLLGRRVVFYTDNRTLYHNLNRPREVDSAFEFRKLLYISTFLEEIIFIEGIQNTTADQLSRQQARLDATINLITTAALETMKIDFLHVSDEQLTDEWCKHILENDPRANWTPVTFNGRKFDLICVQSEETTLICVPASCVLEVIRAVHERNHFGVKMTINNLQSSFHWPTLIRDTQKFIKFCLTCQKQKFSKLPIIPIKLLKQPDNRFETIHMDILGPLPEIRGKRYALTIRDRFTKYAILIPLAKQTAEETWSRFASHYLSRYGCPVRLVTDNGKNFTAEHTNYFIRQIGCHHVFSTPYNPRSNGFIESPNKLITTLVRCLGFNWLDALPYVQLAMNNSLFTSDGYTPAQLVYGCSQRLPFDLLDLNPQVTNQQWSSETVKNFKLIMFNLSPSTIEHHRTPVKPFIFKDLATSESVWLRVDDSRRSKLEPVFKGPYNVLQRFDDYFIIELDDGKASKQSISKLKPAFIVNPVLRPSQSQQTDHRPTGRG